MSECATDLHAALERARKTEEDLERRIFHLKTLFETSRELSGLIQPKKILEAFLLMVMGPLGLAQAMAGLINTETCEAIMASRGFAEADVTMLSESLPELCGKYFAERESSAASMPRVQFIKSSLMDRELLPGSMRNIILWSMDREHSGVLGLGSKISGQPLDEEEIDVLLNLANTLVDALSRAMYTSNVQQLNADIQKKNIALQDALDRAGRAAEKLDSRIFHLKTISDMNAELSPIIHTEKLLETYLLVIMGTLGVSLGFAIVYDREAKSVQTAARGLQWHESLSPEAAEGLLYRCFGASEDRSLSPMSVTRISNAGELFAEAGIAPDVGMGLLYVIDQNALGIVGFGPTITGEAVSGEEEELLLAHTANLLVYLKNARYFEKIEALNEDLIRRNEELRKTIAALTEARHTIALMERARAHLKQLIQGEMKRIGRVSPADLVLIFIVAAVLGILFNFAAPQGISLVPETLFRAPCAAIDAAEARSLLDSGSAVLVDARPPELYGQKHIPGAINLPPALFEILYMMKLGRLDSQREIIVYGRSISKLYDEEVAHHLKQRDHENVRVLSGGLHAWESHGYRVE